MPNTDENVSFKRGSDTGEANAASIQPIANSEVVFADTDNRPLDNLRARTEILRREVEGLKYQADYDRTLLLRSDATFTLTEPASGKYVLTMTGDDLYVYPALTPGRVSGGRVKGGRVYVGATPYSGTLLVNDLTLTASGQYTGQRGYYDADDFATTYSLTLGANRIVVDLIADGALSTGVVTFVVSQLPKTKIVIRYGTNGGATTLAALITAINGDTMSQGSYGVAHFLRASTTAASPGSVSATGFLGGVVQGAYDAEAHKVTPAQMNLFFTSTEDAVFVNRLEEGEGLAIAYPKGLVETGVPTPKGGRRQSLWDLPTDRTNGQMSNITPVSGHNLFSTGREPEKIPGSIALGKIINGAFVFADGTKLAVGGSVALGGASTVLVTLGSTTFGSSGSSLVGYDGSGLWNSDASGTAFPSIPAGTVDAALDAVVALLASQTSSESGGRRVGVEFVAGVPTAGNATFNVAAGSVRTQTKDLATGVARRVSENGHELKGPNPINKDFTALAQGSLRNRAMLKTTGNMLVSRSGSSDYADLILQPMESAGILITNEEVVLGSTSARLRLSTADIVTRFPDLWPALPYYLASNFVFGSDDQLIPSIYVQLTGAVSPDGSENRTYIFNRFVSDTGGNLGEMVLENLDRTLPNFSAITDFSSARLAFLSSTTLGSNQSLGRIVVHHPESPYAAITLSSGPGDGLVMETLWTPPTTPFSAGYGAVAVRGMAMQSNRCRWYEGAVVRDTSNVLVTADKALLDGIETGAPIDATAGHTHGVNYTRYNPIPHEDVTWVGGASVQTPFSLLDDANGDTFTGPVVAGQVVVAYQLEVRIVHAFVDADAVGTISTYTLEASPGAVFDSSPSVAMTVQKSHQYKPVTGASFLEEVKSIIVNCDSSRRIAMKVTIASNVKLLDSVVICRVVGAVTRV